ncbi:MAG: tetratricopeptide repeat protein [Phormidesmis sp.]
MRALLMIASQPQSRQLLGVNQQAYQSLKAAMSLDLRRQLLIAVCDDVALQNQLATQLQNDLEEIAAIAQAAADPAMEKAEGKGERGKGERGKGGSRAISPGSLGEWARPCSPDVAGQQRSLERLWFDPEDANLTRQIAQWMQQTMLTEGALPQVQMLGIEQMTRQPAITQNHFLRSLEKIEALLPRLNTSLLVWMPWPWLRMIQQSAPTFWNWRNGVFEFVSDPTPTSAWQESLHQDETSASEQDIPKDIPKDTQPDASPNTDLSADFDTYPLTGNLYGEAGDGEDAIDVVSEAIDAQTVQPKIALHTVHAEPVVPSSEAVETHTAICSPPCPACEAGNPNISEISTLDIEGRTDTADSFEPTVLHRKTLKKQVVETAGGLHSIVSQGSRSDASSEAVTSAQADMDGLDDIALIFADSAVGELQVGERNGRVEETGEQESRRQETGEQKSRGQETGDQERVDKQKAADDYFAVGYVYRNRIEAGERGLGLIEPAIAAYEGGLRCLDGPHPNWGSSLNDLGTLYWLKAQQLTNPQQSVDCMSHSITLYQEALTKIDPQQPTSIAGQLYSNIGAVYSLLATYEEPVAYLQAAATAYGQALQLGTVALSAEESAVLQNSLGSVYWKLSHYDAARPNLYRAITAYKAACSGYRPDQQPLDYAAVQNNLGITYWSLAKYEQTQELLKQAIATYSNALKYRTPEVDPAACAITYNNLALAYWDLTKANDLYLDQKARYQRNAIIAFEAALNISQAANTLSKMDSAAIYHCLGDVHAQMAETAPSLPEIAESLQKSLYSYLQAIDGLPADSAAYQGRFSAIVTNLRAHYNQLGLAGQQAALNTVPPALLSQVMMSL